MTIPKSKLVVFSIILLTSISVIHISFTIYELRNIPFPWDPAGHAYEGLRIARDLKTGDIISFLADTYSQAFWPFFHSWLLAPAFMVFGNSYAVARCVSLFCLILFIPVVYLMGKEMSHKRGHWIGLIITYFVLTSWPFLSNAAMCMAEIPGLLMTFITLLMYLKSIRYGKPFPYFCTSVLMALTLFTKWHHGIFVITAITFTQLTDNKRILSRINYYLFIPFFLIIAGWFIYPRHVISFYEHSTFQPHFFEFFSFDNFFYYPRSFGLVYHHSLIIAIAITICFIYSLKDIKNTKVKLLVTHILIGIILLTIKLDNRHRYIITIVPSIWILGAYQFVNFVYYAKSRLTNKPFKYSLAFFFFTVSFVTSFSAVAGLYREYGSSLIKIEFWSDERQGKAYDFISNNVISHNHIAVFGSWNYYNSLKSSTIRWNIAVARENNFGLNNNTKNNVKSHLYDFLRERNVHAFHNFIYFLENKDVIVDEYHMVSFMKILDEGAYRDFRNKNRINPFSDALIDIRSLSTPVTCLITIYNEKENDLNYFAEQFMSSQKEWIEFRQERFVDLGIRVTIYERRKDLTKSL